MENCIRLTCASGCNKQPHNFYALTLGRFISCWWTICCKLGFLHLCDDLWCWDLSNVATRDWEFLAPTLWLLIAHTHPFFYACLFPVTLTKCGSSSTCCYHSLLFSPEILDRLACGLLSKNQVARVLLNILLQYIIVNPFSCLKYHVSYLCHLTENF
jgi:hypothetical protein